MAISMPEHRVKLVHRLNPVGIISECFEQKLPLRGLPEWRFGQGERGIQGPVLVDERGDVFRVVRQTQLRKQCFQIVSCRIHHMLPQ